MPILDRISSAWNAFLTRSNDPSYRESNVGPSTYSREYMPKMRFSSERSIIASIYTRIAIDVAGIDIRHVKVDEQNRYKEDADSELNMRLSFEANIDQAPRAFKQDIVGTMIDKGVAAIVPVDTNINPETGQVFDILTVRVGEIVNYYPHHVRVSVYNERIGRRQEVVLPKNSVGIVENPLYAVMNEPNSTLQRLIRKLAILDSVDEVTASGKLDLIVQLPYVIKTEARREQAQKRREEIEFQLKGSQYGIAYIDGTEKVTQLNRPAENNLLKQIEYLTDQLYSELGITKEVMNGTADEKVMLNYYNRTVEPILDAIVQAMQRSFVKKSGFKDQERIVYFRDPFKLVPISDVAEIADKFARNEILSSNEIRGAIGFKPASDPKADQLRNSNMPQGSVDQQLADQQSLDQQTSP